MEGRLAILLFLIGLFLSISGFLILLGTYFIGLSYLLVYVGAVSILFLFILMLINVRISELISETSNSIPLSLIIGILYISIIQGVLLYYYFISYISYDNVDIVYTGVESETLYFSFLDNIMLLVYYSIKLLYATNDIWDGYMVENSHITSIGNIMYTSYSIWLIITSIILLLAMCGAIVITIKANPTTLTR
uniref:NADH dehydrogenase subunit 6 n=1 Tax=Phyllosticta yuccae TaxID=1151444 RepID=UPI0027A2E5F5|nr:NADH dehydrogenase subunit 6 [Phyllosticta yuccae]WGC90048.1 NADH dehydrogenase subunit 6 [Phyllosticta yuccae]